MDWAKGSRDTFTVQGDLYKQEAGERVALGNYTPPSKPRFDGNADLSGGNVLARWTRKLSDDNSFQLQTYYDRTNRYEPNLGERRDTFDVDFIAHTKVKPRQRIDLWRGRALERRAVPRSRVGPGIQSRQPAGLFALRIFRG